VRTILFLILDPFIWIGAWLWVWTFDRDSGLFRFVYRKPRDRDWRSL